MEGTLGQVILFAPQYIPANWAACNGALLPIAANNALFALLGTKYGGDGTTTFALPKLPPAHGIDYIICTAGIFPERG